uniref:HAD hydrolase-like protein n=1 Tax=Comamonas testosteroni TaxID=285 RepID=A0A6H1Q184_COMTE|nr:HAD hydrolase-like protein [Comamonas testosteroni]
MHWLSRFIKWFTQFKSNPTPNDCSIDLMFL